MNKDRGFAGLILIAAAIYGAIWYYRRKNSFQGTTVQSVIGPVAIGGSPLSKLKDFAGKEGLRVTSTIGGSHVPGSLHYLGRAVDVGTRGLTDSQVSQIVADAKQNGIGVIDERTQPAGERQWSGPHLHLQIPF